MRTSFFKVVVRVDQGWVYWKQKEKDSKTSMDVKIKREPKNDYDIERMK